MFGMQSTGTCHSSLSGWQMVSRQFYNSQLLVYTELIPLMRLQIRLIGTRL